MLKEERQQRILDELYRDGKVNVNVLSEGMEVSKATIRRDLTELEEQGILRRAYGGAVPYKRVSVAIDQRMKMDSDVKLQIAKRAIQVLKPDSLIAIDGGSSNVALASMMPLSIKLRVVTNSFPIAEELRKRPRVELIFLGGTYNKGSQTTVGSTVYQQIKEFYFDQCFLGAYAIDSSIGVTVPAPYEDEAPIKRFLVENSAEVNVMGAYSKLDRVSNYVVCELDAVDRIFCEQKVPMEMQKRYGHKIVY